MVLLNYGYFKLSLTKIENAQFAHSEAVAEFEKWEFPVLSCDLIVYERKFSILVHERLKYP